MNELELIYQALLSASDEDMDAFMRKEIKNPPSLSRRQKRIIKRTITEERGPDSVRETNIRRLYLKYPRLSKVIVSILIFLLACTLTMSTEAFRLPIVNFILDVQKEFMKVNVDSEVSEELGDAREAIDQIYILGKTIEGYELISEDISDAHVYREYQNEGQGKYRFLQQGQAGSVYYDTEDADYEIIETIYNDAMLSRSDGIYYLTWFYDGYMFKISGDLTVEELVMLAESLTLAED